MPPLQPYLYTPAQMRCGGPSCFVPTGQHLLSESTGARPMRDRAPQLTAAPTDYGPRHLQAWHSKEASPRQRGRWRSPIGRRSFPLRVASVRVMVIISCVI